MCGKVGVENTLKGIEVEDKELVNRLFREGIERRQGNVTNEHKGIRSNRLELGKGGEGKSEKVALYRCISFFLARKVEIKVCGRSRFGSSSASVLCRAPSVRVQSVFFFLSSLRAYTLQPLGALMVAGSHCGGWLRVVGLVVVLS